MNKVPVLIYLIVILTNVGCHHDQTKKRSAIDKRYQTALEIPVSVVLSCNTTTLIADGTDNARLKLSVHSMDGKEVVYANNVIKLIVDGQAYITDSNGNTIEYMVDTAGNSYVEAELIDGHAHLNMIAGNTPGKVKLTATSGKLWHGGHEFHLVPSDIQLMKPSPQQVLPNTKEIDRMIGADISWLPEMELEEKKFMEDGNEINGIDLLKKHGFNYIRLRIFVNPESKEGYSPGQGYCGLEHTLVMAKRVKSAGLKLLLDFHYSDYWADPQKQYKPMAWEGLTYNELTDTVREYTKSVLLALKDQNTMPDMVQIGNEINHGMIWPDGHISNPDGLAGLINAGISGVRDISSDMPIMIHIATGGLNKESVFWFDNMIARGIDFDIIGISYYPRWHGTLIDLQHNLEDLISRYKKPVNVVEYSWLKKEVHDVVFGLPDNMGKGAAIWEPFGWGQPVIDQSGNTNSLIAIYDTISSEYLKD